MENNLKVLFVKQVYDNLGPKVVMVGLMIYLPKVC